MKLIEVQRGSPFLSDKMGADATAKNVTARSPVKVLSGKLPSMKKMPSFRKAKVSAKQEDKVLTKAAINDSPVADDVLAVPEVKGTADAVDVDVNDILVADMLGDKVAAKAVADGLAMAAQEAKVAGPPEPPPRVAPSTPTAPVAQPPAAPVAQSSPRVAPLTPTAPVAQRNLMAISLLVLLVALLAYALAVAPAPEPEPEPVIEEVKSNWLQVIVKPLQNLGKKK